MYPITLNLDGQSCLVVGGGDVALRKVKGLLSEHARVTVIARSPNARIVNLATKNKIVLKRRGYRSKDIASFRLVFAATDDCDVNRLISEDAQKAGIWVNVADDPKPCTFHLPARVERGPLQLTIASDGKAPFVVKRMRQLFESRFDRQWTEWIEAASRFRQKVRLRALSGPDQQTLFDRFFDATVDATHLRARVPTDEELASWLSNSTASIVDESAVTRDTDNEKSRAGFVSLVGAGPGDAGLLTVRGGQRLSRADAVVYDRLAVTAIPTNLSDSVSLHSVGKEAGHHPVPQDEINKLLVRLAKEGKRVVRLKGGDPFVFGRGGEEAEALAAAGVAYEVVPGVTAAVAVPAYYGIPITHRNEAVRVTMVTAHESIKENNARVRWDLIAADPHTTIVGVMGVTSLPRVVENLLNAGLDPKTPAAMIERGTTSGQRVVQSVVSALPDAVERYGLRPPALFIIGPTVRHAQTLDWFSSRPLLGERFVAVAPVGPLGEALELNGVEIVEVPSSLPVSAKIVCRALPVTGCLLKNAEDVDVIDGERRIAGWGRDTVAFCLSRKAQQQAKRSGWPCIKYIGDERAVAELVAAIRLYRARKTG
jgi:uroporphyrin-III C-methyltransferase / precorrin-2 dehydrogenase / sirohydrochlorin ferrochelatase